MGKNTGGEAGTVEQFLDSTLESVDSAEALVLEVAQKAGFEEEDLHKIGMAVRECMVNAVVHGAGVPIVLDGKVIGAVGVSGESPKEDEDVAKAGAAAAAAPSRRLGPRQHSDRADHPQIAMHVAVVLEHAGGIERQRPRRAVGLGETKDARVVELRRVIDRRRLDRVVRGRVLDDRR